MRRGEIAFNAWTYVTDPAIVEVVAIAGFDAVTFDMEHFPFDQGVLRQAIVTANGAGISPFVRVPSADSPAILPLLEAGVQGILIPHADEDAVRLAVETMRYAPVGHRGALGFSRVAGYGEIPWQEHKRRANEEVALIAVVEDADAVEQLPAIAAIDGLDFITIGAHDLAESLGVQGPNDARLRAAMLKAAADVNGVGRAKLALSLGNDMFPLTIREARELGVAFLTVLPSLETQLLSHLKRVMAELRFESLKEASGTTA
ncbi:MAG: staphyloferrin biosynthesis citrate synthase [Gaiellaceae bacterium]|nr:staphyloferrin biosynthesis citrate synthase [Gaiellaceae bacterium]